MKSQCNMVLVFNDRYFERLANFPFSKTVPNYDGEHGKGLVVSRPFSPQEWMEGSLAQVHDMHYK